jgi:hypothetical protein
MPCSRSLNGKACRHAETEGGLEPTMARHSYGDKRRHACFHDERRNENGRRVCFCDKRRHAFNNACLFYLYNRRRTSHFYQKQARLRYKLAETRRKEEGASFLPFIEPVPLCISNFSFLSIEGRNRGGLGTDDGQRPLLWSLLIRIMACLFWLTMPLVCLKMLHCLTLGHVNNCF